MPKKAIDPLRAHLVRLLTWHDAHVSLEQALEGLPAKLRGVRPKGLPYSVWELLEHARRAQADILEFCVAPKYREKTFPGDYWPESPAPPSPSAWTKSVSGFRKDLAAMAKLAADPKVDLFANVPHGDGQTVFREVVLVADHNAYHAAEIVAVRRLLGAWSSK